MIPSRTYWAGATILGPAMPLVQYSQSIGGSVGRYRGGRRRTDWWSTWMMLSLMFGFTATATMWPCRSTTRLTCLSCTPLCGENGDSGDGQGHGDDEPMAMEATRSRKYQPVRHSEIFIRHLEAVKAAWPEDCDSVLEDDDEEPGAVLGAVYCTGEPHTDPSRMIQTQSDDDFDWM